MRNQDFARIHSLILPMLVGFKSHKSLMFLSPVDSVLRAIDFDPSGWDESAFYVEVFIMPLYVPHDYISFLFGKRINNSGLGWSRDTPDLIERLHEQIKAKALPYLDATRTPLDLANNMMNLGFHNANVPHAIAFSLAKAGEHDRAAALIDSFLPKMSVARDWEQRIHDQCSAFRDLLVRDPAAAHRQLLAWEDYTVDKLGLQKFR